MGLLNRTRPYVFDDHLSYFTVAEANDFRRLVERSFAMAGRDVSVYRDHVQDRSGTTLGLWNIGMLCAGSERGEWQELIADHLRLVTTVPRELAELTPDELEAGLYLRLVETASVADPDALAFARAVAPGLLEILAVDLPDSVAAPSRDDLAACGTLGDLIGLGRANLQALLDRDEFDVEILEAGSSGRFASVTGDSFFTASLALELADAMGRFTGEEHTAQGALVAVPGRHTLLYRRIDAPDADNALRRMFEVARSSFYDAPGALSPNVFWVRNRRWTAVTSYEGGRPRVVLGALRGALRTL
jgi:hypothetical protein